MHRNDRQGKNHRHQFHPVKRVKRILTEKCSLCPKTKTLILGDLSEERVNALDEEIKTRRAKK